MDQAKAYGKENHVSNCYSSRLCSVNVSLRQSLLITVLSFIALVISLHCSFFHASGDVSTRGSAGFCVLSTFIFIVNTKMHFRIDIFGQNVPATLVSFH